MLWYWRLVVYLVIMLVWTTVGTLVDRVLCVPPMTLAQKINGALQNMVITLAAIWLLRGYVPLFTEGR